MIHSISTPRWMIRRLLDKVYLPHGVWMDPCAGEGYLVRYINEWKKDNAKVIPSWIVNDKEGGSHSLTEREDNVLSAASTNPIEFIQKNGRKADLIISNPLRDKPACLDLISAAVDCGAVCAFLLPFSWLVEAGNHSFLERHWPAIFAIPGYVPNLSWVVWNKSTLKGAILDLTDIEEQKKDETELLVGGER